MNHKKKPNNLKNPKLDPKMKQSNPVAQKHFFSVREAAVYCSLSPPTDLSKVKRKSHPVLSGWGENSPGS